MASSSSDVYINAQAISHIEASSVTTDADFAADSSAISAFHASLPHYAPTPLVYLSALSQELHCHVYVKDESSRLGLPSFKILGASWSAFRALCDRMGLAAGTTSLDELRTSLATSKKPAPYLVAATDGNHGRALAYFARLVGVKCTIYVPQSLPESTVKLIRREGPTIVRSQGAYDEAVRDAARAADTDPLGMAVLVQDTAWEGYEAVPAWIVQGYGTMMAEIDDQLASEDASDAASPPIQASADVLITPVGVGSLASSVVQWAKCRDSGKGSSKGKGTLVVTAEPSTAGCLHASLRSGERTSVATPGTIMRGMDCGTVSSAAWPLLHRGVNVAVVVKDEEAREGMKDLEAEGVVAGPCGAAALVALKKIVGQKEVREKVNGRRVVLLCTEGKEEVEEEEK